MKRPAPAAPHEPPGTRLRDPARRVRTVGCGRSTPERFAVERPTVTAEVGALVGEVGAWNDG